MTYFFLILSFHAYSQSCTLTVNLTASNTAICSGNAVILTAAPSAGTPGYNYIWNTGETTPSISVNKTGTYTVAVSDQTPGCTPVSKSITITSGTVPDAPTVADARACLNTSVTLTATAPGGTYQWYDAPTGGNFLATGASYTTQPITTQTTFYVETTISGCASARTPVTVYPVTAPDVAGGSACIGSSVTLRAGNADSFQWYDAPSGGHFVGTGSSFTTPALFTTTNYYVIGITNGCTSSPVQVTAYINPAPAAPVAPSVTTCMGSAVNLHATATDGAIFDWFNVPNGGTSLISSSDYTTPALTATTTYYVQVTINGCVSPRTAVTVTVNRIPVAPTVANASTCSGSPAVLTATVPGGTYEWFATATATNVLFTGNPYITTALNSTTTFYVQAVNGGCTSARTAVNVTVNPSPTAPTAAGQTICSGSSATLTATGPGGSYQWYDAAAGGNLLIANAAYTTPPLTATTIYYLQTTINGCTSTRTAVTVTVSSTPAAPTANGTTVCTGSAAVLSASGTGNSFEWYDAATGGNLLATTQNYTTPALSANTTYYVQTLSGGCISPRTAVIVIVNPVPAPPMSSGATICSGYSATLTASAAAGTIEWYDAATGGTLLTTGNTYNTPALTSTITYYIQAVNGGCASARSPVTVTINHPSPNPFAFSSGTYCKSGPNPIPSINDPGGTFSASPAGLVFVSNTTGEINIAASLPGVYTVSYTGTCFTSSELIAIVITPDATFSYSSRAYCQDGTNPSPAFAITASAGVFTAPAGLVLVSSLTGKIDLASSTPGTYLVTNTIDVVGGCPRVSYSQSVTIDQKVVISAGPDQTVVIGTPVQLAGNVSGAPGATWSGGAGSFSDNTLANAVYTPAPGENGAVTLKFTSANPGNTCGPRSSNVVINFNPVPNPPVAANSAVCSGNPAVLSVTPPYNGTYQWYDSATGGTLLQTGNTYTTPVLTISTIYYVQTTVNGITSSRTAVTVTVNSIPASPVTSDVIICSGNTATLTASGSTGTYEWYDSLTGGNLLGTGSSFTTPFLTADATYYVQTTVNGCSSARLQVGVTVKPLPAVTSGASYSICSGNALSYAIKADMPGTTFIWNRAAVAGISNTAANNQTLAVINETLINTTGNNINVTYVITPVLNGCAGPDFNYVVTVYPIAVVTSADSVIICSGSSVNYNITFNVPATLFNWSRAAVTGISNLAVSGQTSSNIGETLQNTTTAPVNVTYVITYYTTNCPGSTFKVVVTVNPKVVISSAKTGVACGGIPQNYIITSNVPTAVYFWSRGPITGISNAPASGASNIINETLINTTTRPVTAYYRITTINNGCQDSPFDYAVVINPQPPTPVANSNSPVCTANTINLLTPSIIAGGTYLWTGPNGFTSSLKNPVITNVTSANAGTYSLYLIANGCSSVAATVDVAVDVPPISNAGPDQSVCSAATSVQLAGKVSGGTTTGIWTTTGTGTFSPSANQLNAQYIPSAQDKVAHSVKLTLASTSKDDCAVSTDDMTIKFEAVPATNAGPDLLICSQAVSITLNGQIFIPGGGIWSTSGSGTFSPSAAQATGAASPVYLPAPTDITNGSVNLTLTANVTDSCYIPADKVVMKFVPPPTVNAGGIRYVLKGKTIVLTPTVSDPDVTYLWTPNIFINDNTLKNPVITGDIDRTYTLQVTDSRGCINTDKVAIQIAPQIIVPNTFTPNGDGINDLWDIHGLIAYQDAIIDVFDRYGQKVFHSVGYGIPWNGTYNGKPLPFGTYYYVIDAKFNNEVFSGYVTIVK